MKPEDYDQILNSVMFRLYVSKKWRELTNDNDFAAGMLHAPLLLTATTGLNRTLLEYYSNIWFGIEYDLDNEILQADWERNQ